MAYSSSAARPKRAGEEFARAHNNTSKKPRFDYRNPSTLAADDPDDDPDLILDADVIGKSGAQTKRNAINIDGYESDSDNDNFDRRAAEKSRQKKREEQRNRDDDDDMFANDDEEDEGAQDADAAGGAGSKKDNSVRFLDPAEIEGQVMDSTSGGHVSANLKLGGHGKGRDTGSDSESSSGDEEARDQLPDEMDDELAKEVGAGGKKHHAPRLDAFNLKEEEEEGRYDESGNYVRKAKDPDAVNDNWLDGLSKKDMKRAKEAQEKRDIEQKRKALEDDAVLTSDLLSTLIQHLETGESPLEALQRLNRGKPATEKKVPKWKQKKLNNGMDLDEQSTSHVTTSNPAEDARRKTLEAITGAADALYTRGQHEIYDTERELLMRQYKRDTDEDWQPPASGDPSAPDGDGSVDATWEYRWSDARDGGQHHGPYESNMMKAWNEAGYFGEGVEFRKVGTNDWSRVLDVK